MAQRRPDRLTALRRELIRTREVLEAKIDGVRDELRTELQTEMRQQSEATRRDFEATRRHFDVVAEGLRSQLQLVPPA